MTKLFAILTTCLLAIVSCQQPAEKQQPSDNESAFNQDAETEAIMKVIENETKCFFDGDYACWADNWSHQSYAMQAWNNSDASADAAVGWDEINAQGKNWIETYYKNGENIIHPDVKREKLQVKFFSEKLAYLIWKQYNADKEKKFYRVSQETRIMEKEADGWKIVNVSAFWDVAPPIPVDSLKIE
ncbi:MAG: hypothetical protein R3C61_16105 [Bacteroidia bacterium]